MADLTISIINPQGGHVVDLFPTFIECGGEIQEASAARFVLEYGYSWYQDTADPTNPVQENAHLTFTRDSQTPWRGWVFSARKIQTELGKQAIEIIALDRIAKLNKCIAKIDGNPLFTVETPYVAIDNYTLKQAPVLSEIKYRFYPAPADIDPWIPTASSNSTTLDANIGIADTEITGTTDPSGFMPLGLIQIDSEWIFYNGYDTTAASDKYVFKNCTRGALGTTAATHLAAATIFERRSQKIHPVLPIAVQGFNTITSAWEYLPDSAYTVQPYEGSFDMSYDVLGYVTSEKDFNAVRASYGIFDEDSVDAVNLQDVIVSILTEPVTNGGPGLIAADYNVSGLDFIKITRVRVTKVTYVIDFIKNLLDELGLQRAEGEDAIGLWYDHQNDKINIQPITQKAAYDPLDPDNAANADHKYQNMTGIDEEISLEDIYSGVEVTYQIPFNDNLAAPQRMWHPNINTETIGANAQQVDQFFYQNEEGPLLDGWNKDGGSSSNNVYTDRLTDGFDTTGWGLKFGPTSPGANADFLYGWFGDETTAEVRRVENIKIILDCRRFSDVTDPYWFQFLGIADNGGGGFNPADPQATVAGDIIYLSANLDKRFADGSLDAFNKVTIEAEGIGKDIEAWICRSNGMSTMGDAKTRLALIKEITITGNVIRSVLVQLTNSDTENSQFIYAPNTYAKLIDVNDGQPRILRVEVGVQTLNSAISLGRLALLQGLFYKATGFYGLRGKLRDGDIPTLAETATFQDGRTATILGWHYRADQGRESLEIRTLDFNDT